MCAAIDDHGRYRDEVELRWGRAAYAASDAWWTSMTASERSAWTDDAEDLAFAWRCAAESGEDPVGALGRALAGRHVAWLTAIPGTPASEPDGDLAGYVVGLAGMYVDDSRFSATYGGVDAAAFVRDALVEYARSDLGWQDPS